MVETESVNASSMDVVSRGFMNFKIGVFEMMLMLFVFVKHSWFHFLYAIYTVMLLNKNANLVRERSCKFGLQFFEESSFNTKAGKVWLLWLRKVS